MVFLFCLFSVLQKESCLLVVGSICFLDSFFSDRNTKGYLGAIFAGILFYLTLRFLFPTEDANSNIISSIVLPLGNVTRCFGLPIRLLCPPIRIATVCGHMVICLLFEPLLFRRLKIHLL